jgi:hypothetical protein
MLSILLIIIFPVGGFSILVPVRFFGNSDRNGFLIEWRLPLLAFLVHQRGVLFEDVLFFAFLLVWPCDYFG